MRRIAFAVMVVAAWGAGRSYADTLHVPGDYSTIQAALYAAQDGDTVVVADGTYTGDGNRDLDFNGRLISLRSANGPENCTIDCQGSSADPHRAFYFNSGEGRAAVVDGFTISNGYAVSNGGGIYCLGTTSRPTIKNCTITGCTAEEGSGGGIGSNFGSPLITSCLITDCRCFTYVLEGVGGGGIYCYAGTPELIDNRIIGCWAEVGCLDGGGAICFRETDILIRGNDIRDCFAHGLGGGIAGTDSQVDISNNIISGCTGWHYAGGLALTSNSGRLFSNLIADNEALDLYAGGVLVSGAGTELEIAFCTIAYNAAPTEWEWGTGGGIYVADSAEPLIHDCILWGNVAYEGPQIWPWTVSAVSYCDVEGGWPGMGNIDDDPLFVDSTGGNFRLTSGSPCISAGDPAYVSQAGETDLDGHARLLCERVDMGAYEFGIGDYNCDRSVDLTDFANWDTCMTGPDAGPYGAGCRAFDFEFDIDVDLADFAGFQSVFDL